jgi:hypothetical protein
MPKQRKIRAILDGVERYTSTELLTSETLTQLVYKETPNAIEEAIKTNSTYASIFEINNSGNYVDIHKRDWISALSVCLSENVTKEDYAACSRINELITKLQKKQTKTVKEAKNGAV